MVRPAPAAGVYPWSTTVAKHNSVGQSSPPRKGSGSTRNPARPGFAQHAPKVGKGSKGIARPGGAQSIPGSIR